MDEPYNISSRDYLKRARQLLDQNQTSLLFHAAFELRCGIESRMQEYLDVQDHISKKKRRGWQVAKLGKNIEETFKLGDKKAILRVKDKNTKETLYEFTYTPVTSSLRKKAERLGNALHNAKKFHPLQYPYWSKFRSELEETYKELEVATSGNLLGPALMHPGTKQVGMKVELPIKDEETLKMSKLTNQEILLEVRYE